MALKIRLQRHGSAHAPVYRVVVAESTARRDGRFVENIGVYNPKARGKDIPLRLDIERVDYWIKNGAQPTDTARSLIRQARKAAIAEAPAAS